MHTLLIEKTFIPSLAHNDVFSCSDLETLIQTIETIRKVVLSGKWELLAEEQADKEIETAHMILGIWTRLVQNRYPWTVFHCLNIV